MRLTLSKSEISALREVCEREQTAGELAEALGVKDSFVSRILGSLKDKGLIAIEKNDRTKIVRLSLTQASKNFRELATFRRGSKIESWLSGSALDVLVIAGFAEGASIGFLMKESKYSRPTIYKALRQLKAAGALSKIGDKFVVTDELVNRFANDFADTLELLALEQVSATAIRVRKHVILRTDKKLNKPFTLTGLNALRELGSVFIPTSYNDYYLNLDGIERKLTVEACFIHALVLSTLKQYAPDKVVLAGFLKSGPGRKVGLDFGKLRDFSKVYSVESQLDLLRTAVGYSEKLRE
ncbi:MarR family transcriptional regulator [Candidatus Micrarchaeota archaeon]|nr:MarR family transcriptional regulator [Candidatus Micrarchaeota archaeon]